LRAGDKTEKREAMITTMDQMGVPSSHLPRLTISSFFLLTSYFMGMPSSRNTTPAPVIRDEGWSSK
jgi:hypothetical protein